MNEEKKLSKVLDEIFGSYINNENESIEETGYVEQENDYFAPLTNLNNFMENLFLSKEIITEPDLMLNRIPNIKLDMQFMPIAPPPAEVLPKENEPKHSDIYEDTLPLFQQAYIAKAICNQLCELFYAYKSLSKSSKNIRINMSVFKNQIMEIKPMAELIHRNLTNKEFQCTNSNLRFGSYSGAFIFIKSKIKSILNDIVFLKNNTMDINVKKNLTHIKNLLYYQLGIINAG